MIFAPKDHVNECADVSTELPRGHPFVYLFLACSWFFLFNWCVLVWTREWGHQHGHSCAHVAFCFHSRRRVATYLFSRSLRMLWSTLTHISVPRRLSSGLIGFWGWLGNLAFLSPIDNRSHLFMKPHTSGSGLLLLRWWLFWEGNCPQPPRARAETTDSQMRKGHSLFCPSISCVTDELWMRL